MNLRACAFALVCQLPMITGCNSFPVRTLDSLPPQASAQLRWAAPPLKIDPPKKHNADTIFLVEKSYRIVPGAYTFQSKYADGYYTSIGSEPFSIVIEAGQSYFLCGRSSIMKWGIDVYRLSRPFEQPAHLSHEQLMQGFAVFSRLPGQTGICLSADFCAGGFQPTLCN